MAEALIKLHSIITLGGVDDVFQASYDQVKSSCGESEQAVDPDLRHYWREPMQTDHWQCTSVM